MNLPRRGLVCFGQSVELIDVIRCELFGGWGALIGRAMIVKMELEQR